MRRVAIASAMGILVLALGISTAAAGAFDALSPGDQKIATALFQTQKSTSPAQPPLTLDQIAAQKQSRQGWGEVFDSMKSRGLLQEKNLGEVVSNQERAAAAKARGEAVPGAVRSGKARAGEHDGAPSASIGGSGGPRPGVGSGIGSGIGGGIGGGAGGGAGHGRGR